MSMTINIVVTPVEADGKTRYIVEDKSSPARLYGDTPDTGPFDTEAEAERARREFQRFVERDRRRNPSLAD